MGRVGNHQLRHSQDRHPKRLVQAAVDAVDRGGPLPTDVYLDQLSEKYHIPPRTGGLLEQDAGLIYRMNFLSTVYKTVSRLRGMVGAEIHDLSIGERRLIAFLLKENMLSQGRQ